MNITKALEVAAEYRAEGKKWLALADDIEAAAKKAENGFGARATQSGKRSKHNVRARKRGESKGYLAVGMDVLREVGHPMHVTDMLPKISGKMGKDVARPNVEGALVRGVKQGKIKRTRPSTYALM
ncbi:MAG: hypothetical protein A3H91_05235 [Gammaproteobacteria bacterium RIFCSPLOWO2_02_FULL_61_13]|nr:MAG: hypothetical protein A3H91_05235 [Gammaproteobacteria bacterium RIFCSPLOWO2_02_FULL_61_13]